MRPVVWLFLLLTLPLAAARPCVRPGVERLFEPSFVHLVAGKRVGLLTNHTGVDSNLRSTREIFKAHGDTVTLVALFAPEHGIDGSLFAERFVSHQRDADGLPIWSLHGEHRRPSDEMLRGVEVLVCDLQDVGTRCYTYVSTLFYCMEEAAKRAIPVVVLDRPNPLGGELVDGPVLEEKYRSFLGYLNVPLCHGMTIGELARYFNGEYQVGCALHVVPMQGWRRKMVFRDTGLPWVPTSPQIPEPESALCYPATSLLGEALGDVSVGVGHTLPFKVVGATWIDGKRLAEALNRQKIPGVTFQEFAFIPFFGRLKGTRCSGVRLVITDPHTFKPVSTQGMVFGVLKSLYPDHFQELLAGSSSKRALFGKIAGSDGFRSCLEEEGYIAWKLIGYHQEEREQYVKRRKAYLLYK